MEAASASCTEPNSWTSRSTERCSIEKPAAVSTVAASSSFQAKRERRPVSRHWSAWNATKANGAPRASARPARSAMAEDMQRCATTASGAKPLYSPDSASAATNSRLRRPAASAAWRAAVSAVSSRSIPTTRPQRGARASARRPRPVPTSRTVRPSSRSAASSFRNAGLIPWSIEFAVGALPRPTVGRSSRNGTIGCARDEAGVLCHDAPGVAGLGLLHGLEPLPELGAGELHVEAALLDVDDDRVAGLERGDRSAVGGLGRDVADHEAVRGAREAAVGHQRDLVAEPGALDGARHVQHLAHAGPTPGPFPSDHDHVVRFDLSGLDRGKAVFLAI